MTLRTVMLIVLLGASCLQTLAQCDGGPVLNATTQSAICGNFNGSITYSITGGVGSVDVYLDGSRLDDTVMVIDALPFGFYTLEAIDSMGCSDILTLYVGNLPGVEVTGIEIGYDNCDSTSGAFIDVSVSTTGEVEYSSDGLTFQANSRLTGLSADSITVFVRDEFGCTDNEDVFIPNPFPNIIRVQVIESNCQKNDSEIWAVYYASWGPYYVSVDGDNYYDGPALRDLAAGEYTFYVRNDLGCVLPFSVSLSGPSNLSPGEISIVPATCAGNNGSVRIKAAEQVTTFSLRDHESDEGVFRMLAAGEYTLRYIDTLGCERDTVLVVPELDCQIYFSNVFSPNGDGVNDTFKPVFQSNHPEDAVLEISDRWGNTVYSCSGECSWDGGVDNVVAANGVYVYLFRYTDGNGMQRVISGDVTLLR